MSKLSNNYLFVAAIDFGTTYSGYAFSSRDDFKKDPLRIVANQAWNGGSQRHLSLKTPTCLLLNSNEELVSFGYEAENKYADVVMDGQQHDYFFFQRFKMQLYNNKDIKEEMKMKDVTGKSVSAKKVFAKSIEALKHHLFGIFEERGIDIEKHEIRWVLTVPTIWSDTAKQFMRRSAELAGIAGNQLLLALEPEAASIYCQYLPIEKLQGAEKGFCMTEDGTKYMVVDNGGGTTDITVHQKIREGKLKEISRSTGGNCGGTSIDSAFYNILENIVGLSILELMKKKDPSAYLDIFRELEAVKKTVNTSDRDKVTMTIPKAVLDDICKQHLHKDLKSVLETSSYNDRIVLRYDKFRINADLIKNLFAQASTEIVKLICDSGDHHCNGGDILLLVGGFSECKVIQENIKASFPKKRVIVPEDAGLAVLKGAVLFGHEPDYIASRIVRYTYGIRVKIPFNPELHDKQRMEMEDGIEKCDNIFFAYAKRGSVVQLGENIQNEHETSKQFQENICFSVFQSPKEYPMYIDENECQLLGKVTIDVPVPSKEKQTFICDMMFGNTEVTITVTHKETGKNCHANLDLI